MPTGAHALCWLATECWVSGIHLHADLQVPNGVRATLTSFQKEKLEQKVSRPGCKAEGIRVTQLLLCTLTRGSLHREMDSLCSSIKD